MPQRPPAILAILGSPRKHGACAQLLHQACRTFPAKTITWVAAPDLSLSPCKGCQRCSHNKPCRLIDDFSFFLDHLKSADAVLLAAPVYFYGFPGPLKTLIDRCHPLWHDTHWQSLPKRPGFFISTCASDHDDEFAVIRKQAKAFFNTIRIDFSQEFCANGLQSPGLRPALQRAKKKMLPLIKSFREAVYGKIHR